MAQVKFSGVAAFEGVATGDGRIIEPGALRWNIADGISVGYSERDTGHDGLVSVGRVTRLWRDGDAVRVEGWITDEIPAGAGALAAIRDGRRPGVSVMLSHATALKRGALTAVTAGRIRAVDLVRVPAFAGAIIQLTDNLEGYSMPNIGEPITGLISFNSITADTGFNGTPESPTDTLVDAVIDVVEAAQRADVIASQVGVDTRPYDDVVTAAVALLARAQHADNQSYAQLPAPSETSENADVEAHEVETEAAPDAVEVSADAADLDNPPGGDDIEAAPVAEAYAQEQADLALFRDFLAFREWTQEQRQAAAESGEALPDGSYPIRTVADLRNAVRAVGRASDQARAREHIIARARALNALDELPDGWLD